MPKITLENTAAKGANLADRVGKFDDNQALDKLKQIQANLGPKGTAGSLRIIYTTKSNKDLQFETRNRKWWGGLYTPSAERQEKNKTALRELFNKAGKDLSPVAKKEFEAELDHFFQQNAKGIKDLAPLIQRFKEISLADRQSPLISEYLLQQKVAVSSDSLLDEFQQDIKKTIHQENLDSSLKSQIVEEQHDESQAPVKEENDISVKSFISQQQPEVQEYQEQPIENGGRSSLKSRIDEQPDAADISLSGKMDDPQSPRLSSFIEQENEIENEQQVSFHSNIEGDQGVEQSEYFFQQADEQNDGFGLYRDSLSPRNSLNFQRQSVEFQETDPQPNIDVEGLRLKAADKLKEIQSSTLPKEIEALARKVSDFQNEREHKLTELRERANEIQGRFENKESLPSIPDYLRDLEQLNADIKKFSESGLNETSENAYAKFQDIMEEQIDALMRFLPEGRSRDDHYSVFPELELLDQLKRTLDNIASELDTQYTIKQKPANAAGIQSLYSGAYERLDIAERELSEITEERPSIESFKAQIQDLKDFKGYVFMDYDQSAFETDRKKLNLIEEQLLASVEVFREKEQNLGALLENLQADRQAYQLCLGEDFNAGQEFLNYKYQDAIPNHFDQLIEQTLTKIAETQSDAQEIQNLLKLNKETLSVLEQVLREEIDIKEKQLIDEQVANERELTQKLQNEKLKEAERVAAARVETIETKLYSAIDQCKVLISQKSSDSFKKLKSGFPKELDAMTQYIDRESKKMESEPIPSELIEKFKSDLTSYLKAKILELGPVDSETRNKWEKQISNYLTQWSELSLYSSDQKEEFEKSIRREWENKIISEAERVISNINQERSSLSLQISAAMPAKHLASSALKEEVENLQKLIKSQQDSRASDFKEWSNFDSQKPLVLGIRSIIDKLESQDIVDGRDLKKECKKLATKISELNLSVESVDNIFDQILENLQGNDEEYLSQLKAEYEQKNDEIQKKISNLIDRINVTDNELKINQDLLKEKTRILNQMGDPNPLESAIRSLDNDINDIKLKLNNLGLEISQ